MTVLVVFLLYALTLSTVLARRGVRSQTGKSVGIPGRSVRRVLIVGATGGTGRQLVMQALERGLEVTALVRNPAKLQVENPHLKIVQGDVLDHSSVEAAVRGHDAVICALGHRKYFYPTRILSEGTRNLLRAMETHGVSRLICESSLGIGDGAGRLGLFFTLFIIPVILPFYFWDKTRQERVIEASRVEWVIVRPGVLNNKEKRKVYRHGSNVGSFFLTVRISRADVADFMLNQLTSDSYVGTAPGVCW